MEGVFLERQLAVAVMAFYSALSYAMSFYGLPREAHEALTARIDAALPDYLS